MRKFLKAKSHLMLSLLIVLAAVLCFWLAQQFSNTLIQITASELLHQEAAYLQQRIRHTQPTQAMTPSRPYFSLQSSPNSLLHSTDVTQATTVLQHDTAVQAFAGNDNNPPRYALKLTSNAASESPLWLVLDLNAALPLSNFLALLQVICAVLILLFASASLALLLRLGRAQQRLVLAIQREQDFVNDISHELRTPLAIIQNALTVSSHATLTAKAVQQAKDATMAMTQQLTVLLALARKQQTPAQQLPLLQQLEHAMFSLYQTEPAFVSQVQIDIAEDLQVNGNPQLIHLLLLNIISNACYHSGGARLFVQAQAGSIIFRNEINRQPDGSVAHSPYYQGFGHGNSLIRRIADALSWPVHIQCEQTQYIVTLKIR